MSLMQLLTNGKTLVDLKNSTSRYHMPGKNFLPKFGPAKNPFTPQQVRPVAPAPAATPKPIAAVPKIAPAALKETQRLPVVPVKLKETKRLPFVAARKVSVPAASGPAWWERFLDWAGEMMARPGAWLAARKTPVKSAIPRFEKPVVQGELSLENIKVVRNDLSDADMEVVPAKTFTGETNFKPALQTQINNGLVLAQTPVS